MAKVARFNNYKQMQDGLLKLNYRISFNVKCPVWGISLWNSYFHQVSLILYDSLSVGEGTEMAVDTWTQGYWIAFTNDRELTILGTKTGWLLSLVLSSATLH